MTPLGLGAGLVTVETMAADAIVHAVEQVRATLAP